MRWGVIVVAIAAVIAAGVGLWQWQEAREQAQLQEEAERTADAFLLALSSRDPAQVEGLTDEDAAAASLIQETFQRLEVSGASYDRIGDVDLAEDGARAEYRAELELAGLAEAWNYTGELDLIRQDDSWVIAWSPGALHPRLREGSALELDRSWPERSDILDRDGHPLDAEQTSLRRVVGEVGEVTDERLEELGEPYRPGDTVGLSGLQAAYERELAGEPVGEIVLVNDGNDDNEVLDRIGGREPRSLTTTIDPDVQRAADQVLGGGSPRAIVAIDPVSGDLLAVANGANNGFNRAMSGRYPPGSTFKIVTAAAILRDGTEPDDPVTCPRQRNIGGWNFRNFEEMELGTIPFRTAVYESCNTAFVQLTADLPDDVLMRAVEDFGFNVAYDLGLPTRGGSFPEPENVVIKAAAGFGQAQVEATPMHMASVAAAVASGRWNPPRLVLDPESDEQRERREGSSRDVSDVADTLAEFMSLVVSRGTAADSGLPRDVSGKTGTAEYGTGDPLPTHAWFIGFAPWDRDDEDGSIAFATLVEDGESGGRVAAPLTGRFLRALRGG